MRKSSDFVVRSLTYTPRFIKKTFPFLLRNNEDRKIAAAASKSARIRKSCAFYRSLNRRRHNHKDLPSHRMLSLYGFISPFCLQTALTCIKSQFQTIIKQYPQVPRFIEDTDQALYFLDKVTHRTLLKINGGANKASYTEE